MQKSSLIGVSIAVVCLFVLTSFTNVVGVQTVESTNHTSVKDEVDQKELLFQTILDIANNKEIQRIILNSEMRQGGFFNPGMRFSVFTHQVLTKKFLNAAYHIGLILIRNISNLKIHSMLKQYQVSNQGVQKGITAVIEKNATLEREITQLSISTCDCEKNNTIRLWNFPVVCALLIPIMFFLWTLWFFSFMLFHVELYYIHILLAIIFNIGSTHNCFWA